MIGFVALVGIEIKTSILLVDFTNQLRAQGDAAGRRDPPGGRGAVPPDRADDA